MMIFFKGILIGVANIIPGLSGGTMAVILGIYERLIASIHHVTSFDFKKIKREFVFLMSLFLGAAVGIICFANVIDFLLESYREPTFFFFIGTVVASIPVIYRCHDDMGITLWRVLCLLVFFCIPLVFLFFNVSETSDTVMSYSLFEMILLGMSGFIAAAAMILPGVSGSFILLLLGSYSTIVTAIKSFDFFVLAVVGVGVLIGIVSCSKSILWALKQSPSLTYFAILGLVLGALPALWPGLTLSLFIVDCASFISGLLLVKCLK